MSAPSRAAENARAQMTAELCITCLVCAFGLLVAMASNAHDDDDDDDDGDDDDDDVVVVVCLFVSMPFLTRLALKSSPS